MPKCLECGAELPRLQWTHFKYNCTGKFKNGKEYKQAYPGATLVDPILAQATAVTLQNLIKKYGEQEGNARWEQYRTKQAISNSFEYKKEKHGWSEEQYNQFNRSRSQTLEIMILRHGEGKGLEMWNEYCAKQSYTKSKEYLITKYGKQVGEKKFKEICIKKGESGSPIAIAKKLSISLDEAVELIVSRQRLSYVSELEKEFVLLLEEAIGYKLEYTNYSQPFGKWSSLLNSYVVYDIKHKNLIIEFNGDYWHANPAIYKSDAVIRGKLAIDIQQKDMLKLKTAEELGFKVLVVWETDFKKDKQRTIVEVKEWISNQLQ